MKRIALAFTALGAALSLATPTRALGNTMPSTACEGVFKTAKYYVIEGPLGIAYVEGRDGDKPMARYMPAKIGNTNGKVIQTGGVDGNNQKKFANDFFLPAKLPGWGWVVRSYEGDADKTQFVWFARPETEPSEIKPITFD